MRALLHFVRVLLNGVVMSLMVEFENVVMSFCLNIVMSFCLNLCLLMVSIFFRVIEKVWWIVLNLLGIGIHSLRQQEAVDIWLRE